MKFKENNQKIWMENEEGKVIAEIDFPETGENSREIGRASCRERV